MDAVREQQVSAYDYLRQGLIVGRWKSGEHLVPARIKQQLSCSGSVLRDAMLQLAGEGLIILEKNHGFRAVVHTKEAFRDAAHLRLTLEREAVKLALTRGDFDWELDLSAAFQKLAHVEKQMCAKADVTHYVERWATLDWEFHETLMRGAGSDIMTRVYRLAFDTFRMYSIQAFPDFGFRWEETASEHKAIYEAAVSRNQHTCAAAVKKHIAVYYSEIETATPTDVATTQSTSSL